MRVMFIEVDPLLEAFIVKNMILRTFQLYNNWLALHEIIDAYGTFSGFFEILGIEHLFVVPHKILDRLYPLFSVYFFPLGSGPVVKDSLETEPLVACGLICFGFPFSCLKIRIQVKDDAVGQIIHGQDKEDHSDQYYLVYDIVPLFIELVFPRNLIRVALPKHIECQNLQS